MSQVGTSVGSMPGAQIDAGLVQVVPGGSADEGCCDGSHIRQHRYLQSHRNYEKSEPPHTEARVVTGQWNTAGPPENEQTHTCCTENSPGLST